MNIDKDIFKKDLDDFLFGLKSHSSILVHQLNKKINNKIEGTPSHLDNKPINIGDCKSISDIVYSIDEEYHPNYSYFTSDIDCFVFDYFKDHFCKKYGDPDSIYETPEIDDELCLAESDFLDWYMKQEVSSFNFENKFWDIISHMDEYMDILQKSLSSGKVFFTVPSIGNDAYTFAKDNYLHFKDAMEGLLFYRFKNKEPIQLVLSIRVDSGLKSDNKIIYKVSNIFITDEFQDLSQEFIKKCWTTGYKSDQVINHLNFKYVSSNKMLKILSNI